MIIADIPWKKGCDYSKLFESFRFTRTLLILVDNVLEAFYEYLDEAIKKYHWYYHGIWLHDDTYTHMMGFTHDKLEQRSSILRCDSKRETYHPEERPVELMLNIIRAFSYGGLVFDPFMGSGSSAVAANMLGNDYIGYEINNRYFEEAKNRLCTKSL